MPKHKADNYGDSDVHNSLGLLSQSNYTNSKAYHRSCSYDHQSIPSALLHRSIVPNLNRYSTFIRNVSVPRNEFHPSPSSFSNLNRYNLSFPDVVSTYKFSNQMNLLSEPQIKSPHFGPIRSLDIDNSSESRFLLCAGADCTISVFDLSPFDEHDRKQAQPISQSRRDQQFRSLREQRQQQQNEDAMLTAIPVGHKFSISSVQWYPVDTGMFISSDLGGRIIVWDTNLFEPAFSFEIPHTHGSRSGTPYQNVNASNSRSTTHGNLGISCMMMPKSASSIHFLAAVASHQDSNIRLCDVTSGTYSHQLIGHGPFGVHTLAWSPQNEFMLVSGGDDCTIRVWDIRKSGSGACVMTLDRECCADLNNHIDCDISNDDNLLLYEKEKKQKRPKVAPNNFSHVRGHVQSHGGSVMALEFTKDGQYLVSAGRDFRLRLWDFRHAKPLMMPSYFLGSSGFDGGSKQNNKPHGERVSLSITQPGSQSRTTTLWCGGNDNGEILGYDLHGGGGKPKSILVGHLVPVSAISTQENMMRLFTGSSDGMIMGWGCDAITSSKFRKNGTFSQDRDDWGSISSFT